MTEGGQYCDQATDDDTAAGKPPRPPTAPEEKNRRAHLVLVCPGCPEGCDYMPDTRPDRYRDQDGEVIPPVIEEPDIIPPGSHLPYRVRAAPIVRALRAVSDVCVSGAAERVERVRDDGEP